MFKLNSSLTGKLNTLYSIKVANEYLLNEKQHMQMGRDTDETMFLKQTLITLPSVSRILELLKLGYSCKLAWQQWIRQPSLPKTKQRHLPGTESPLGNLEFKCNCYCDGPETWDFERPAMHHSPITSEKIIEAERP